MEASDYIDAFPSIYIPPYVNYIDDTETSTDALLQFDEPPNYDPTQPTCHIQNKVEQKQKNDCVQTIFMKTPRKLKKVPLKFSTYIPNVGKTSIVFKPDVFDTNMFMPKFPRNIVYTGKLPESDDKFREVCENTAITVSPRDMHFAPAAFWPHGAYAFGDIVSEFFQRKNNVNCRFYHKLFNALQISKYSPDLIPMVGVQWVTDTIFRVNAKAFARLLGIKSIDGALFHQQGNFPSHGFVEISKCDIKNMIPPESVKFVDCVVWKAFYHKTGALKRESSEDELPKCNWTKAVPQTFNDKKE